MGFFRVTFFDFLCWYGLTTHVGRLLFVTRTALPKLLLLTVKSLIRFSLCQFEPGESLLSRITRSGSGFSSVEVFHLKYGREVITTLVVDMESERDS